MKQLTCEMCGSTDLLKQEGVFVCQVCGCKYSLEEAKKMMVEGTVEVSGTVKVDDSGKLANYFTMAENAYESGNKAEAENYCNKIIESDPSHYKAWFMKGKAAGWQSTLRKVRIEESVNCFTKAIDNAPEDAVEGIKTEAAAEISALSSALMQLACNNFAKYPSESNEEDILNNLKMVKLYSLLLLKKCGVAPNDFYKKVATTMNTAVCSAWRDKITKDYRHADHPGKVCWQTFKERCFSCIHVIKAAIDLSDDDKQADIQRYKNLIDITEQLVKSCSYKYSNGGYWPEWSLTDDAKAANLKDVAEYHKKIKEIDPSYLTPDERPKPAAPAQPEKKSGCYVATAVYGSYDCPEVWTLRRFRDDQLAKSWYGRAFIRTYYAISPTLVKWFGESKWFKNMWKPVLDGMVEKLNSKGVEDTPYNDRNW